MDFAEAIQLPTSRSFWNSHDPALDHPFDETLLPTMAPLEGSNCSSTFLFPSTSSACDTGGESPAFKRPFQQSIFEENINLEGGAAESKATAQSYCTIAPAGSMDSSQFSWLAAPHHHAQGVCASQAQLLDQSPANAPLNHQVPCFFGALNSSSPVGSATSSAPDFGHGSGYPSFSKPLMRQPSTFCRPNSSLHPVTKQLNAKASWQSAMAQTNATSFNHKQLSPKEGPLDSPCSVVSGFTKLLQRAEPAFPDFEMESFGPSTSAGQDKALRFVHSQDPLISREAGSAHVTQSLSGIHDVRPCKRKRSKGPKQGDEVESQRRTHIAVERNRRKQMNEHLAALRALMPGSYVQKGDQASIVGGAIEFVKELEHLLNCLQSQKRRRAYSDLSTTPTSRPAMPSLDQLCPIAQQPFSFHSPQRVVDQSPLLLGSSTDSLAGGNITRHPPTSSGMMYSGNQRPVPSIPVMAGPATATTMGVAEMVGEAKSEMASVEVKRVGAEQVLVNIMAPRRSGQLLRTVVALESLALIVMHTNITTVRHTVLYSFHVQLELSCRLNVDELAVALHHSFTSLHSLQF